MRSSKEAPTTSKHRLRSRDDRDIRLAGRPSSGSPSSVVDPDLRADGLEEPRHQVDLHVVLSNRADELEHLLVAVPRESHDHTIDLVAPDDLADLVRRSEDAHIPQIAARLPWAGIDEADQVDPVFRMLEQLATDELANLTRADDERVLDVGRLPACESPCNRAPSDYSEECEGPEGRKLGLARASETEDPRRRVEEPDACRQEMEDACDLISCRVRRRSPRLGRRARTAWPRLPTQAEAKRRSRTRRRCRRCRATAFREREPRRARRRA